LNWPAASWIRTRRCHVDALLDGHERDFGSDPWVERMIRHVGGGDGGPRPIFVIAHANAFLARHVDNLGEVLATRLFRHTDLLLDCNETFYERHLRFKDLGGRVYQLLPWTRENQASFAESVLGSPAREWLERWLDHDPTRISLCERPLHLVYVLSLFEQGEESSLDVETAEHLFEEVAQLRVKTAPSELDSDEVLTVLGRLAHDFYADAKARTGVAVMLEPAELRKWLRHRRGMSEAQVRAWADALEYNTLLKSTRNVRAALVFEHPSWSTFFVARHIVETLRYRPGETARAFSKYLSADIATRCDAMLREALERDPEAIRRSLQLALSEPSGLDPDRARIARQQIGYFLGVVGNAGIRAELAPLIDPTSNRYEADPWVRRGILSGLADGGDESAADAYVDALRAERERGEHEERDGNVASHLTFRGDQRFEAAEPDALSEDPECARTVAELVRGLRHTRHPSSRRIRLFTLIEISTHRAIPRARFLQAVRPHLDTLDELVEILERYPRAARWPEIEELTDLILSWRDELASGEIA
jgi:hypothetical protein